MKRINSFKTSNTTQKGVVNSFIKRQTNLWLFAFLMLFSSTGFTSNLCPCEGEGFTIGENMQSITYISQTPLNNANNTLSGGCLTIHGRLIIDIDFTFDGASVIAREGAEIFIAGWSLGAGSNELTIQNNTVLLGCETMWRGITVDFASRLTMENSIIRDAQYAVRLERGSGVDLSDNRFYGNYVGVYVPPTSVINPNSPLSGTNGDFMENNLFDKSFDYKPPYSGQFPNPGTEPYAGIFINNLSFFSVGNNSGTIKNTFKNIRLGVIFNNCKHSGITGAEISDLVGQLSENENIGVFIRDGDNIRIRRNTMDKLERGIASNFCKRQSLSLNTIDASETGILVDNTTGQTTLSSNIISSNEGCISILNSNNGSNLLSVRLNTLTPFGSGIQLSHISGNYEVRNNTILFTYLDQNNSRQGISAEYSTGLGVIKANDLLELNGTPSNVHTGLFFSLSENIQVYDNYISGALNPTSNWARGITAQFSPDISYCCNEIGTTLQGYLFLGMNSDNLVSNTTFNGTFTAPLFLANAIISDQFNTGNDWTQAILNSGLTADAWYSGDFNFISQSEIKTESALVPNGYSEIIVPVGATPQDWFDFEGTDPTCPEQTGYCGELPYDDGFLIPDGNIPEELLDVLNPQTSGDIVLEIIDWEKQKELFQILDAYPDLMNNEQALIDFYNAAQNDLIGDFYAIESGIKKLYLPSSTIAVNYDNLQAQLDVKLAELDTVQAEIETAIGNELAQLLIEEENLKTEITDIYEDLEPLEIQIQSETDTLLADLIAQNEAISTQTDYQGYEKDFYRLYLNVLQNHDFDFTAAEQLEINTIAEKCPFTDGVGVYGMRYLKKHFEPNFSIDDLDCWEVENRESDDLESKNTDAIIYPNPTSNQISIELPSSLTQEGRIDFYDSRGLKILSETIFYGTNSQQITLEDLPVGFYFIKVFEGEDLIANTRLTIVK